ncbi:cellular tumor antigen p53 isoform X2 [Nilaparvata lugens]|uniref:cellular tumor antigen p53 isoform X2 n=1 Tax=Nilaparvata lugens TaxID=108931 RepID=UPI00193CF5F8|nr:cellular tumor antigen p53 isoform X2 [Nilaparvata lugens]
MSGIQRFDQSGSYETQIINDSDLEFIMGDLRGQQFSVFLPGSTSNLSLNSSEMWNMNIEDTIYCKQECTDEICDSTQENNAPIDPNNCYERLVIAVPSDVRSPTGNLPCLDTYPGIYDFGVELGGNNSKHAWVFSPKLGKVFIDVNKVLLFKFRLNTQNMMGLRVRALPVYIIPDHINNPVNRCTLHAFKCDPNHLAHARDGVCLCADFNLAGHVVTATHANAEYEYNADSGRHSVVVPLDTPHAGSDTTAVAYQFGCKTSCPGGMSRRPINLVFTLETEHGQVVGRSVLPVKVCSCPKRDKEREEADAAASAVTADSAGYALEPRQSGHSRRRAASSQNTHSAPGKAARTEHATPVPDQSLAILMNTVQHMSHVLQRIHEVQLQQREQFEQRQNELLEAIQELSSRIASRSSSYRQKQ